MNQLGLLVSSSQSIQRGVDPTESRQPGSHHTEFRPASVHSAAKNGVSAESHVKQPMPTLLDNVVVFPDGSVMWVAAEAAVPHEAAAERSQVEVGAGCCCQSARSHHSFLEKVAIALLLSLVGYLLPLLRFPPQNAQALCQTTPQSSVR
ncbi:hypothetical protein ACQ4M4_01620 [Leptolyngbya sp. AN02str]|uniref:hypothetical protein n=1 Tax=Leptolyngbya sp. AN02str TaxID=3423363 RepID=UPI003D310683